MALTDSNNMTPADIAAVTGNSGWGSEGGLYWLLILFLFCFMGWGGNGVWGRANGGPTPYQTSAVTQADVQRGFDQSAVINHLDNITGVVSNGFANAEVSRCNAQANLLQTLNGNNNAVLSQLNTMAYNQLGNANNCAANIADLKYTVSQENAADRNAVAQALNQLETSTNAKVQAVLDKLCQQEIEAMRRENDNLRQQLNMASLSASQNQQTGQLLAAQAGQTNNLLSQLKTPAPIPAYVVSNPYCTCDKTTTATAA